MRGEFDRLIDLYYGTNTATPWMLKAASVPARLVSDEAFVDVMEPLVQSIEYLTMDEEEPSGPTTSDLGHWKQQVDYGQGDLVALYTGGPVTRQVVRVESRTWPTGENYWRAHLTTLLEPGASPCSLGYAEEYEVYSVTYGTSVLHRAGPTTWTDGTWTLEAEVAFYFPCTCESHWRIAGHGGTITSSWTGSYPKDFTTGIGPLLPGVTLTPLP